MKLTKLVVQLAALLSCTSWSALAAEPAQQLGLATDYQANSPTIEAVLGYPGGSRISSPEAIEAYFNALAKAYPEQVQVHSYGRSWEGRNLYYVVISSAENMAKLGAYQANIAALSAADSTSSKQAEQLIKSMPASVWLSYGVHGNEISSPEAAMLTAWHLLAATDATTQGYLDQAYVFIDPVQNPDGRARFVSRYYMTAGLEHSSDRLSAEHNEPWPSGRSNHYLFDLNRDWLALTQPEIAGQVDALLINMPLVYVDLHEMGGDTSYYFTPEAEPYNPLITETQRKALWTIGENNGKWFDQHGYDYYTREVFDAFYPGYGASWPLYHGAISMTYEMASARGHHFRTKDGEILTYGDGVQRHFIASIATIETVAKERQQLLQSYWDYRQQSVQLGRQSKQRYWVFNPQQDAAAARRLAGLLTRHGVKVEQAEQDFKACGNQYAAGSFIVDSAQPAYYMLRTLLDKDIAMDADFIAEQERRRKNNLADEIYDVTAWSLPQMFNVSYQTCAKLPRVATVAAGTDLIKPGQVNQADANVGFIVPWGDMNAGRFLTAALREGLTVKQTDLPFTHSNGKRYPAGSLILTHADNANLAAIIQDLAVASGAQVDGVNSSWVTDGPNFGSNNVQRVHAPQIAMLWDEPVSSLNAGHTRFVIEQQFNYPVTAIRAAQLAGANLSQYQVLIMPAASSVALQAALGERGQQNIQDWVAKGGVLITLGSSSAWAVDAEFLSSALESVVQTKAPSHGDEKRIEGLLFKQREELMHYIQADHADPYWTAGVITRLQVDQEHWLSAGVKPEVFAVTVGNQIFRPLTIDHGRNIVNYAGPNEVLASGYLWAENQQQLAYKPYLMWQPQGRGMVISFAQEPTYRAYLDGLNILLMNAIFAGASHASPLR
ncbi:MULTISPECIES: M14 family zinc carboxypeptidase [Idiomarina]|uniref:M14 family zinc carboxypeptidase n=1 Tax=Idiomarina TaxID=135575 RepID=UPI00129B2D2D|nr:MULTISPECIES: M14 family zinc carboxypeptidase [Idiomarina]MRJ40738.1 peptidase M14 [Idiomarina sp. FeN1]NCU56542.1 peptidase M14 [Idiomarina sp. FenA--70]NCU58922.1 peptidase M14 [Idiomarina sp. FenBw--71]UUN14576.1 peptidase M14 [Idiomarina loihiensis]